MPAALPPELAERRVVRKLREFAPEALLGATEFRGQMALSVAPARLRDLCEFLRRDPELEFDQLVDVTAVDRYPLEPRFEAVYHLRSLRLQHRLRLKAPLRGDNPRIESLTGLWAGADVLEREVYDLFGIRFDGHPNLRRLLMPDDWEGHPLRKDYPVEGYR
ncbi:MAG TPA: NADH-quinone oxidoreductase subunit C [Candidatus Xenobia bacterium]|nr:NADH-quinone oxidoreductase subunit C [Candidatus Xenobia bacterium]